MKYYVRNVLIASAICAGAFLIVVITAMMSDVGVSLSPDDEVLPDSLIFIASVFFTALVSWGTYFVFWLIQRRIADNDPNATWLGLGPRIIAGVIGALVSALVLFLCFYWVSDEGEIESILALNKTLAGVIMGVFVVVNGVNCIVFKPRH